MGALVLDNRFEVLDPIGEGGMGIVFGGRDRTTRRAVAIKTLRAEVVASAQKARLFELRATNSLGRLLKARGRQAEARIAILPLLAHFNGQDAIDVREAVAMLTELSCSSLQVRYRRRYAHETDGAVHGTALRDHNVRAAGSS